MLTKDTRKRTKSESEMSMTVSRFRVDKDNICSKRRMTKKTTMRTRAKTTPGSWVSIVDVYDDDADGEIPTKLNP